MDHLACYYKCMKCQKEFSLNFPGPTRCLHCGNQYVKWINHEQVVKRIREAEKAEEKEQGQDLG